MTDEMRVQSIEEIRRLLREQREPMKDEVKLHAEISRLYHRAKAVEQKVGVFGDRFFNCLQALQQIIDNPQQSGMLAQKGIDILKLGVLVAFKIPLEFSPDYDSWELTSLSYKTAKKYFPDWGCAYIYKKDPNGNDLHSVITHDKEVFERMARKMTRTDKNRWEHIGHVRDLIDG